MGLDDTLASREEINRAILHKIYNVCLDWGMQINQVEVLEIQPTNSIQEAMHKQLSAERVRRAAIVTAEGYREQVRTEAEGAAQAAIAISNGEAAVMRLKAEGVAKSKELLADAEARAVETVASMLQLCGVEPTQYLIAMRYLEAFSQMARQAASRHVIFPIEASLHGAVRDVSVD
jgi:regulator of protease activity HflC (stomatin/prohibitin superfamily)